MKHRLPGAVIVLTALAFLTTEPFDVIQLDRNTSEPQDWGSWLESFSARDLTAIGAEIPFFRDSDDPHERPVFAGDRKVSDGLESARLLSGQPWAFPLLFRRSDSRRGG